MRMRTVRGETNSMENGSAGLAAYSFSGNSFGADRPDDGQHHCRTPADVKYSRALVGDFARVRRRIKICQLVGQIIKIGKIAEIAADIHRIIQQSRRLGGSQLKGFTDPGNCAKTGQHHRGTSFVSHKCNDFG